MTLFVLEIRHDGLVLSRPSSDTAVYWLPGSDFGENKDTWISLRDAAVPGMAVNITLVPGRYASGGLQVVSLRGPGVYDLSGAWKGEVHPIYVESLSKTLIRGKSGSIDVVMPRDEYTAFLNGFPHNERIQEHGAIALGDYICGVFSAERGAEGRVQVSFLDALKMMASDCSKHCENQQPIAGLAKKSVIEESKPPFALFHTPTNALSPILFVENDELCRRMWGDLLAKAGVEIDAFGSFDDALSAIRNPGRKYKMAILDVHLWPGAADYRGLDLARALAMEQPECRIVLSSAEDDTGNKNEAFGAFPIHGYISKPALLDEWTAVIDAAAAATQSDPLHEFMKDMEQDRALTTVPFADRLKTMPQSIVGTLDAFCTETPGLTVHVFRLHPRSSRGRSVAGAGENLKWEPYRGKLGKSLIRDVAESPNPIVCGDTVDEWRHRWTKAMMDYQSFWGQRLEVPGHYRYVLVAFHPTTHYFNSEMQLRAQYYAEKIARILSIEQLERRGAHDAEHFSAGLGFACLAHETYGRLTGVAMAVKTVAALLTCPDADKEENRVEVREIAATLDRCVPELVVNARILRGSAGGDKPISVLFCLERAVEGIRQAMSEMFRHPENIAVEMRPTSSKYTWMTKGNAGALVTIFFNILLNAAQQIEMLSLIRPKGWISVSLQHYEDVEGLPWALVHIGDSGPGIHPEDWDRVFDPGHTTREDGTGLGLHICRQLIARLRHGNRHASVWIARSVLWAGTTMAIRLPLVGDGEGNKRHDQ